MTRQTAYRLGNVQAFSDRVAIETTRRLIALEERALGDCLNCRAKATCHFSCPAFDGDDPETRRSSCAANQAFYRFLESEPRECLASLVATLKARNRHGRG
jgi:radical SAM protein with 4Fe4S-binding SPASM domain